MQTVYVIYAYYSDKSGDTEFIKAFLNEDSACHALELIEAGAPMKTVKMAVVNLDAQR